LKHFGMKTAASPSRETLGPILCTALPIRPKHRPLRAPISHIPTEDFSKFKSFVSSWHLLKEFVLYLEIIDEINQPTRWIFRSLLKKVIPEAQALLPIHPIHRPLRSPISHISTEDFSY